MNTWWTTGQPAPPPTWRDILALGGEQPFHGLLVLTMLAAVVVLAMSLSVLLLRAATEKQRRPWKTTLSLWLLALVAVYFLATAAYFTLRFVGRWTAGDMATLALATKLLHDTGTISTAAPGPIYPHGVTYQALSLFLVEICAIPLEALQTHILPFVAVLVTLVGFVAYRALVGNNSTALLAMFLICLQPDFLFVVFRGSHEKATWSLVLLLYFILAKSVSTNKSTGYLARLVVLFYLAALALIATNQFFASSFIAAMSAVFAGGSLLLAARQKTGAQSARMAGQHIRRLLYITLACSGLQYIFIAYLYPPANHSLRALRTLSDRLAALLLNFEPQFDPYAYVPATWQHPLIYPALSAFSYVILIGSLIVWIAGLPQLFRKDLQQQHLPRVLLWFLYPGFALQVILSTIVDQTGWVGGNLQVRLFTPTMLVAAPLMAEGLARLARTARLARPQRARLLAAAALCGWFSLTALLKMSNEPILGNQWMFFTQAEQQAGAWASRHITEGSLWVGPDVRLHSAISFHFRQPTDTSIRFVASEPSPDVQLFLLSDIERQRYRRQGIEPPSFDDDFLIYDNGPVQIYRRPTRASYPAD